MEKTNILFVVSFLLGIMSLMLLFTEWSLFSIVLGVIAVAIKIDLAKKGHKSLIATIGSYSGVVAIVFSVIQNFL